MPDRAHPVTGPLAPAASESGAAESGASASVDGGSVDGGSGPVRGVVAFARALRASGLAVPVGSVTVFAQALGHVGISTRSAMYWAGRATLVSRMEDLAIYDRVFSSFWEDAPRRVDDRVAVPMIQTVDDAEEDEDDPGADGAEADHAVRYSAVEVLAHKDFAALSAEEWSEADRLITRMKVSADLRRSRRARPSRARRGQPDLGRTLRRSLRTGGETIDRSWRTPTQRPRRLVLLVDVSGSMEPYARALLRFAHAATSARGAGRVEVFTLGTRLTRLTRELTGRDPDAALAVASASVLDWSGGTRLGDGLREFNDRWGSRGMARGAVVVVLSDGWDRGDPGQLGAEMARLHRVAYRVVWANPLKGSAGYEPLARGMAAALPWVDDFVEGHAFAALEHLAAVVAGGDSARSRAGSDQRRLW